MEFFKKYETWIYIFLAYFFSVGMRMLWVFQYADTEAFKWNNQLMINTNDGYYFATAVKHMLFGTNEFNQLIPTAIDTYTGTIYSIYFLAKILPFSLDTIILYMPTFISSLIVIPIVLTMKIYNKALLGFLAALLASITWSYYNRTMTGYFDTDMYALVFPVFILYFLIKFANKQNILDIFIVAIFTLYGAIFLRNNKDFYKAIIIFAVAIFKIMLAIKLTLFLILYFVYKKVNIKDKYYIYASIVSIFLFLILSGGWELILSKIDWYTKTGTVKDSMGLQFYDVAQTIREAGKIPFNIFADRISGSIIGFVLAVIGYIVLSYRHKEFLLFLPLVAIGFFAYKGGLRFTVYAIPAMAMGVVYLFWEIANLISEKKNYKYFIVILMSMAVLYPNIRHISKYNNASRSVMTKPEVQDLNKLKKISNSKDYTLTWWDYGYPIWYYSDTNTLIDGGKHHNDNFIISKILQSSSPDLASNFSRLAIEKYVDKNLGYSPVADVLFKEAKKDPNEFLLDLESKDFKLPKKSRDIYLYMPFRMTNIFYTVMEFGNLDLTTGKPLREVIFYPGYPRAKKEGKILLSNGLLFDTNSGKVYFGKNGMNVRYFIVTQNRKDGAIKVTPKIYHKNGSLAVIYLESYNKFIVMDIQTFASNYVQMGLLGNYDKDLFELVVKSPYSRIYKLKR